MESWEINHFLFSREDDKCIYLYTKHASHNGKIVNGTNYIVNLLFVDGELPENFIENNKWQVHYPLEMYEWVLDLLMKKNPVYLNMDISKKRFLVSSSSEAKTERELVVSP